MLARVLGWCVLFVLSAGIAAAENCRRDSLKLRSESSEIRFSVELAVTPDEQRRGLMFRENLARQSGMLFVYDPPQTVFFWMKNTLIPLDMIFADRTGTVRKVHQNAIPGDLTAIPGGDDIYAVLEINAGLAARYGIAPGAVMQHEIFSGGPAAWPC